jgi:hypothetical protein
MTSNARTWSAAVLALAVTAAATACGKDLRADLDRLTEARLIVADLSVQFAHAASAADRAVMGGPDAATAEAAGEAAQAASAVDRDRDRLKADLDGLGYAPESALLAEFGSRWESYRQVNAAVLDLARDSSNLKAQRLAFGPVQEAADACVAALDRIRPASAANDWRVRALAAGAAARIRELQALEAPHIAASDDARMASLEGRMADASKSAEAAVSSLGGLASPASAADVSAARQALTRLLAAHAEVIGLSRRNSNVHAVAMSLGQARIEAAACEETLRALAEAIARRTVGATR